jgi:lysozyme family protein
MTAFEDALQALMRREGDYVNDPADRGGETRFGITRATALRHGYGGPMRDLPLETATAIYRDGYWAANRLEEVAAICPPLAARLFDIGVNLGVATAARFLQRALNLLNRGQRLFADLAVDGAIGPGTLEALSRLTPEDHATLVRVVVAYQGRRYLEIAENDPTQERFMRGWIARLEPIA